MSEEPIDPSPPTVSVLGTVEDATSVAATVHTIDLCHRSGIEATVSSYGAGLISLAVPDSQRPGRSVVITHTPVDLATLQTVTGRYVGATIGRFANRIAGAAFDLDGVHHQLDANEPPNHLHGGADGFDHRVWDFEVLDDSVGVRFSLVSVDGDSGYPGTVRAEATYRLFDRRLEIDYRATTDVTTPINLTNHTYWNLAGPDGDTTIGEHRLRVELDQVLLVDDAGIPVAGPPVSVAGTRFTFDGRDDLETTLASGGLDHSYVGPVDAARVAIVLEHPPSGRRLSITTDQPAVQIYTGQHFVPPHRSVAFEPQQWPNSPNRPDFPSPLLHPGETYRHRSTYRFDW